MKSFLSLSFTAACFLLIVNKQAYGGLLQKPSLSVSNLDTNAMIMLGDNVSLDCETSWQNVKNYSLVNNDTNVKLIQSHSVFILKNIQTNMNAPYSCSYCGETKCSEHSELVNIYASDTYPAPSIAVTPRRIVLPGSDITITCRTTYSNIIFTLFQNDNEIKTYSEGENPVTFHIKNASDTHTGQYTCKFEKRFNRTLQMESTETNPMMIRVEDLEKPSLTCEPQPKDSGKIRIHCASPNKGMYMWFQLLNDNNDIEDEIEGQNNNVTFIIEQTTQAKHCACMYRVRLGDDFADSRNSNLNLIPEVQERPLISKQSDRNNKDMVLVTCQAPKRHVGMGFQLLNQDKEIQEERRNMDSDSVTFHINKTENTNNGFLCIYQVRMECGFVPSAYSEILDLKEDYTSVNIIRLFVSAVVLLMSGVAVLHHYRILQTLRSKQKEVEEEQYQVVEEESAPDLPEYRVQYVSSSAQLQLD